MKKISALVIQGLMVAAMLAPSSIALAQLPGDPEALLGESRPAGVSQAELPEVIGRVITVLFSLLGIIAVIIIIYSGFEWMTSGGAEDKIKKAKGRIINAVIGIAIILLAYSITSFILTQLGTVTA